MPSDPPVVVDHDVFVVHADDDTPFVKGELLPMLGLPDDRVILSSELPFPAFTEQAIADSVRRSRLTLAVLSPAYLRDRWAGFAELLSRNVNSEAADGGTLVPLLLAECAVPTPLAQHAILDCRTLAQREAAATRVRQRLGQPEPQIEPITCPYPGMRPFSAETAEQFHGRTREIDELVGRLEAGEREIYVIGPSGSGKSSLVAAGVIPRLQGSRGDLDKDRFTVRTLRPGEHPTQRLAEALGCETSSLDGAAGALRDREGCNELLLFIDQLEELFALADAQERQDFARALRVLRADRCCHLIVALRADFYGALMSSELWPDIDGRFTRLEVAPLRVAALREAIETPARDSGAYLERALVERLISDATAEPGALPLLQEALVLLWRRRSHRLLSMASYDEIGQDGRSGLAVALARRADAILHDFTPPQRVLAQRIFLRLVSFGEGRPDTRRQQPRATLSASGENAADVSEVIDRLIEERMLTSDATPGGEPLIDLSHEALIAGWPELQRWLLTRRDDEQRRRLLELHAAEWVKRGCGGAGLFDAVELVEAERWIAGESARELGYSDDLRRFLAASRAALEDAERQKQLALEQQERDRRAAQEAIEEAECQKQLALAQQERDRRAAQDERARSRRRIARIAIVALTLFSIVASIIGLVAWRQREEAQRQLGFNELDRGRALLVDSDDLTSAIPHLIKTVSLGVDNVVLHTVLADVRHGLWRTAVRHGGPVQSAVFSPDGSRVVTASEDGTARIWDAATGAPLGRPLQHMKAVWRAAFSPDGSRVVTASEDGTARVWDAATGAPLGVPLQHRKAVRRASFSPDGSRVVTASEDGTARVWDAATGVPLGEPLRDVVTALNATFSPDGSRVVTAGHGTVRIWNAATGAPIGEPLNYDAWINDAEFSPDGSQIITASRDDTARLWDATTGAPLGQPLKHEVGAGSAASSPEAWVNNAAFSPDGSRIVTASDDGTARLWDAATGAPLGRPLKHRLAVLSAAFSPDGSRVVTASVDGTARVWDATTGAPLGMPLKHELAVLGAAFSPDGSRVVTASEDGTARVWDATTPAPLGGIAQQEEPLQSAAFSPDGSRIVTFSIDGTARVWDATTGGPLGHALQHERAVLNAAFSTDGSRVVTASDDGAARVWNVATGDQTGGPLTHHARVNDAAFSPDGSRVVTASGDGTARLWNATTGAQIGRPLTHKQAVRSAAFSPDGSRIVTVSDDGIAHIWNAVTPDQIDRQLKYERAVRSAAFSPDGSRVVTAGYDDTARLWNAATGDPIGRPLKHERAVQSAAFSPDGSRVVTASDDGTARLWDAATGAPLGVPLQHEQSVRSAAFSPDASRVVTASDDGTARIWDATTGAPLHEPFQHGQPVRSAAFSPDGLRIATTSDDGTARVWDIMETGTLSDWVDQARRCVVPDVAGSCVVCPLSAHDASPSELPSRVRSLTAAGDAAMFSAAWSISRANYEQAIALLDDKSGPRPRTHDHDVEALRRTILFRLTMLDALEEHLKEARARLGSAAPATDVSLLNTLGGIAHEELKNDAVALRLLLHARDLNSKDTGTLANLAEIYFVIGKYDDFARSAAKLDTLAASSSLRIAMSALSWATARLTRTPEDGHRAQLLRNYQKLANGARLGWIWEGTQHALRYGRLRREDVKPILDVLAVLEEPVSDETRARLARLLEAPRPTRSDAK